MKNEEKNIENLRMTLNKEESKRKKLEQQVELFQRRNDEAVKQFQEIKKVS